MGTIIEYTVLRTFKSCNTVMGGKKLKCFLVIVAVAKVYKNVL